MKSVYDVLRAPVITEKGTLINEAANQVVFKVRPDASKEDIRNAVESLFKVRVVAVRTANYLGKKRRVRGRIGIRPAWKKAYVTLAEGQSIDFFENV